MKVCSVCQKCHDESVRCGVGGSTYDGGHGLRADMVPGYELVELALSRGSSDVYRAREAGTQRSCLIKIISADDQSSECLLSEARFATGLFHPAIAVIYKAGQLDDDRCYIVAEAPDGRTLRDFLDSVGAPGLLDSIEIIRQAADALQTLHLAGLFHRAINPSNIVLSSTPGGRRAVKLQNIDFGGADQRAVISNKFTIDSELDTLKYFAPEQFSGEEADGRTDVYSLGIVFYELLAGAPPFEASNAVTLIHKQKNQPPADVRIDSFNLRMLVTHALTESLQKRPSARQSSANLLARQLRHIEQLATRVATPPPAGTVSARPSVQMPMAVEMMPIRYVPPAPVTVTLPERSHDVVPTELVADIVRVLPELAASAPRVESEPASTAVPIEVSSTAHVPVLSPRRSRLKGWKKRLHQLAGHLAARAQVSSAAVVRSLDDVTQRVTSTYAQLSAQYAAERKPKVIEWRQPDDVPPMPAVVEALNLDAVQPRLVVEDVVARHHETVKPSAAVLVETSLQPAPDHVESSFELPMAAAVIEPVIQLAPPVADLPIAPIPQIEERPAPEPVSPSTTEPEESRAHRKPSYIQLIDVEAEPSVHTDIQEVQVEPDEEITLVRPPRGRRIRVSLDRLPAQRPNLLTARKTSAYARQQREFVPTLLGGAPPLTPAVATGDNMMFSAYASTRAGRSYRSTFIAVAIFGVTSLLLFGNDSVTRYFQTWTAADSVASTRTEAQPATPPLPASGRRPTKKAERSPGANRNTQTPDKSRNSTQPGARTKLTASVGPVSGEQADRKKDTAKPPTSSSSPIRPRVVKN